MFIHLYIMNQLKYIRSADYGTPFEDENFRLITRDE